MFLCSLLTFAQFSGSGSGTESDPYLILNPIQLNQLRNFLNMEGVYFKLMADIDLTEYLEDENPSQGWQPVGTSSAPFKGILDGNGKTVSGLWIDRGSLDNVGLIGCANSARIKNLVIKGKIVKGKDKTGILCGEMSTSTISNCFVEGKVYGCNNVGGYIGSGEKMSIVNNSSLVSVFASGNYVGGFVGSLHGDDGELSNCYLKTDCIKGNNYVGGFCGSNRQKGTIVNSFLQADIDGINYVGGLFGYTSYYSIQYRGYGNDHYVCYGTSIESCGFCGRINAQSYVGGIVGEYSKKEKENGWMGDRGFNQLLSNCYSVCIITSSGNYVGGVVGNIKSNLTISDSYFSGTISGNKNIGGIAGLNLYMIQRSYSKASISGSQYVGGITGTNNGTIQSSVSNNSRITALIDNEGKIFGISNGSVGQNGSSSENKALNRTVLLKAGVVQEVNDNEQNGTSVSPTTLKLKATYVAMGWDFTDIWEIQETECYPYMKSQTAPPVITSQLISGATAINGKCVDGGTVTLEVDGVTQQMVSTGHEFSFTVSPLQAGHEVRVSAKVDGKEQSYFTTEVVSFLGKGTEADPYQISTAADLTQVYRKGYFKLMNDIDLTEYINSFSPSEGWQSIGREGSETIHFDGNGYKITGLWCNSTRDNTGLFSCFANGTIKNLTVETAKGKQVKGGANTGILIGKMINGTIENCQVSGTVADGTPVGGLVGLFDGGKISLSQANVTINTTGEKSYIGGLVGEITSGEIDQCSTLGTMTAMGKESYVGGLVGKNSATVTNCYSNAIVSSTYNAAGLIAYNYGVVDKCYATGNIFSTNYGAGVVGYNDGENAVVKNSAAMNNKIDVTYESQQVQQGGGYGQRIIGGIKNGAPAPELNNYALKTMQVSLNNVPQRVYDDIMNGVGKNESDLTKGSTYQELGWDFTNIWKIAEGRCYPVLLSDGVRLDKSEVIVKKKNTVTLKATFYPETLEDKSVTWKSSDETVATVSSSGKVKGIKSGVVTITCTSNATGLSATCKVTVATIALNKSEVIVRKKKSVTLKPTVYPTTLADKSVIWKSSDKTIATVSSSGKVTGVKSGVVTITCTSNATGVSTTCKVTVATIALNKSSVIVRKKKSVTLKPTVYPTTLEDKSVTWKSSDESIATVSSDGVVTGVKSGVVTITCTSNATGVSTTCTVTVGTITLNKSSVTLAVDNKVTLKPTVYPTTLEDQSVTWKSSNTKVATVKNGKVTGVKAGTANITCTSNATGLSTTCKVTVTASASARTLDDEDTELTDIEIAEVAPAAEEPFDVYDLKGHQVLHQVTSLDGLPAGVYIVNGKKVMKK